MPEASFNTAVDAPPSGGAPEDIDYDLELGQSAAVKEWWNPAADRLTVSGGLISAVATEKTAGGGTVLAASGVNRPTFMPTLFGSRGAFRFRRSASTAPTRFNYTFPAGADKSWTILVLLQALSADPTSEDEPIGSGVFFGTGNTNGFRMELTGGVSGEFLLCRGGAANVLNCQVPRPVDEPFLAVCAYDHVAGRMAACVNAGAWTLSTATGINSITTTTAAIGALPNDGSNAGANVDMGQGLVLDVALHLSANLALWNTCKQLYRDDYGLTFA